MTDKAEGARLAIWASSLRKSFPHKVRSWLRVWAGLPSQSDTKEVLAGVNLVVPEGELIGILGGNGAGKSTLLRVLAGVYPPDSGMTRINGEVAALFELGGLGTTQLTGRAFTQGYFDLIGVPSNVSGNMVEDVRDFSELEKYFEQKISTYSSGMAARLYFAVATAIQQKVYLIDEILTVGDEHFQVKSQIRMKERLLNGASGVLVTHDWASVVRLCRDASILADGRLSEPAPADEAIARYLDLTPPPSDVARINVAQEYRATIGRPLTIIFEVDMWQEQISEVSVSIDVLEPGFGWEPIVLTEFVPIAERVGKYKVAVRFPFVPMRPGKYSVGVFLTTPADATGSRTTLDARAWTYGNSASLVVEGSPRADLAPFPIEWSQVSAHE